MTTEPITKQRKGNITLTWNDKPLTPVKPKEAPKPEPTPAPAPEEEAAAPTPAPVAAPAAEATETAEPTQPTPKKKSRVGAFIVDSLLVLALAGVIGGGAWYTYQQLETYRVPTPMELAQAEYLELCKQHEQLQDAAYKADEQLHLRERLNSLELQLAEVKRNIEEHKRTLDIERDRVLAVQNEIRQEDKSSRGVARSMIIGLPIGHASRSNGKVYTDAIIHRMEGGRVSLRTATGPVTFPLGELVKDNLPDMARYALGLDDMVDMSDFEAADGKPLPQKKRKGKIIQPRKPSTRISEPNYEPAAGAPVVSTQAPPATITVEPGLTPEDDGSWQAPEGALPIGE